MTNNRVCFELLPEGSPAAAEARIDLPLASGPYSRFPLSIQLPLAGRTDTQDSAAPTILLSSGALVTGEIELPGRRLLVGYVYDPRKGTLDPTQCLQFADLNGDGKLDEVSERDMGENGKAPIFHVGSLYLRTTNVDLNHRRVTLTAGASAEYKRFDLWPGAIVPDFSFPTLDGRTMKLSEVKARVVLLDFWATWCAPCVADLQSKKAIYARYHERGFEIVGMDGDSGYDAPTHLVAKLGLSWLQGKPSRELLAERFNITSWPTAILLDEHRRILSNDITKLDSSDLAKTLDQLLPAQK